MGIREARRARLLMLIGEQKGAGKQRRLAALIGKAPAQVSQWVNRTRTITEETARHIEAKLKKPKGWLDLEPDAPTVTGAYDVTPVVARERMKPLPTPQPPAVPPSDFHETRAPSNSEWQVLRDIEVYPEEERKKLMAELHAQAERWRAIERELTARAKAKAKDHS